MHDDQPYHSGLAQTLALTNSSYYINSDVLNTSKEQKVEKDTEIVFSKLNFNKIVNSHSNSHYKNSLTSSKTRYTLIITQVKTEGAWVIFASSNLSKN